MEDLGVAEERILRLMSEENYEEALKISQEYLQKPVYEGNSEALGLLFELNFRVQHLLGNSKQAFVSALFSIDHHLKVETGQMKYIESYLVAGQIFHDNDNFQLALNSYQDGLEYAGEDLKPSFRDKVNEIENLMRERAEKAAQELLESQAKPPSKSKNQKKKEKRRVNRANKEMHEQEKEGQHKNEQEVEGEHKNEQDGEERKQVKKKDEKIEVEDGRLTFGVPFMVTLEKRSNDGNFQGTTTTDTIKLQKSFVSATFLQVKNFTRLQSLCSCSPYLLTLENVINHPSNNIPLLVCELADSVDEFFKQDLQSFISQQHSMSKMVWWNHISSNFMLIFRDVVRGLLFLFKENKVCGNLGFNMFVTPNGRGRILPSLDPTSKRITDVEDLITKMQSVISFPFQQDLQSSVLDSNFGLPEELISFFSVLRCYIGKVPPSFLVDHPFFWTIGERIDFIPKLSNLLRKDDSKNLLQVQLETNGVYEFWENGLKGVYHEVWRKGDPNRVRIPTNSLPSSTIWVRAYSQQVDIVRFFGAAYKHVNDLEYKNYRCNEVLTEDEIERDLIKFFPRFYVDIFSCICSCVKSRDLNPDLLKLISSCYYRDEGNFINALLQLIAGGDMLGELQPVILHLFGDVSQAKKDLDEVEVELRNAGYPLLRGVIVTMNVIKACKGVDLAILSAGFSYKAHACALAQNCKVLVVSDHANINALILERYASSIPKRNITYLTRLEHNRALCLISEKLGVKTTDVKNVIIWGKNSSTQNLDVNHARVKLDIEKSVREIVVEDAWLDGDLVINVQQSACIIEEVEVELAKAACDHIRDWVLGTPKDTWISMGVYSDGSLYNVPAGIFYSFPVTCVGGEWKIVEGLTSGDLSRQERNAAIVEELLMEKNNCQTLT